MTLRRSKANSPIDIRRWIAALFAVVIALGCALAATSPSSQPTDAAADAIADGKLPAGYRDWRLISISHEEGDLHSFAAVLGNDVAIQAFREGKLPYPDGTIIASLHYRHVPSEENNKVFGREQSFVPGSPTNIQFMVKDSTKYSATGSWLFAHFVDGKSITDKAKLQSCYDCHSMNSDRDLVFAHYAP
jgi:hypothetical protein